MTRSRFRMRARGGVDSKRAMSFRRPGGWQFVIHLQVGKSVEGFIAGTEQGPVFGRAARSATCERALMQRMVLGQEQALLVQLPQSRHLDLVEATPWGSGILGQVYQHRSTEEGSEEPWER
jgi:hypothetical protein